LSTLKLHLSPGNGNKFKVIITASEAGEGETESSLPFFDGEKNWLSTLVRCLEMRSCKSDYFSEDEKKWMVDSGILDKNHCDFSYDYLANIGKKLFQGLFPPDSKAKNAFLTSLRGSERENQQLHIQLRFSDEVSRQIRLADYPWELLHDGNKFLLHRNVTISRYIAYEGVVPCLPSTAKVNVLLLSSTAFDKELKLDKLDDSEVQAIFKGLEKARNNGHINLASVKATRSSLRTYLTENRGENAPLVLHFDGHGLLGKRCTCGAMNAGSRNINCRKCQRQLPEARGYLAFEDGNGGVDYVSAEELGILLSTSTLSDGNNNKFSGIALVVLSACQSSMTVEGNSLFNGTAQNLIGQRIPSVVAMQYSVLVDSATRFAEQFYRSLGQRNSLRIALSQAREAMGIEGNQWYRPVLYLRWQDNDGGQLFGTSVFSRSLTSIPDILKSNEKHILACLKKVYQACSPDDWPNSLPNTLEDIWSELTKMPQGESRYTAIEKFIIKLITELQTDSQVSPEILIKLQIWANDYIKGYSQDSNIITNQNGQSTPQETDKNHYLIVTLRESNQHSTSKGKGYYFVDCWLIYNGDNYETNNQASYKQLFYSKSEIEGKQSESKAQETLTLQEIPQAINCFLNQACEYSSSKLTIEIFLSLDLINEGVDSWEIENGQQLGVEYKIVVRSLERCDQKYGRKKGFWIEKWEILKQRIENREIASSHFLLWGDENLKQLFATIQQENKIGLTLQNTPIQAGEDSVFAQILKTAIPVALWLRRDFPSPENQQFHELLQFPINELVQRVKDKRLYAYSIDENSHIGHHISLLWEDPYRLPPSITYSM
jgi:vWA-MoxR associated protein C-terminal domain/CHAT domain/vWA-MoxR associated protein middle region (VMAP-M) 1